MKVMIPTPLRSYTNEASHVAADGPNLSAVLRNLDERYPGIRFRMIDEQDAIRAHIRFFVNGERRQDLDKSLVSSDEIQILQALSGG